MRAPPAQTDDPLETEFLAARAEVYGLMLELAKASDLRSIKEALATLRDVLGRKPGRAFTVLEPLGELRGSGEKDSFFRITFGWLDQFQKRLWVELSSVESPNQQHTRLVEALRALSDASFDTPLYEPEQAIMTAVVGFWRDALVNVLPRPFQEFGDAKLGEGFRDSKFLFKVEQYQRRPVENRLIQISSFVRGDLVVRQESVWRALTAASQTTKHLAPELGPVVRAGYMVGIVMDQVAGTNLEETWDAHVLTSERAVAKAKRIAQQIGDALRALHDTGLFHGDVAARNIIEDVDGNLFLVDFEHVGSIKPSRDLRPSEPGNTSEPGHPVIRTYTEWHPYPGEWLRANKRLREWERSQWRPGNINRRSGQVGDLLSLLELLFHVLVGAKRPPTDDPVMDDPARFGDPWTLRIHDLWEAAPTMAEWGVALFDPTDPAPAPRIVPVPPLVPMKPAGLAETRSVVFSSWHAPLVLGVGAVKPAHPAGRAPILDLTLGHKKGGQQEWERGLTNLHREILAGSLIARARNPPIRFVLASLRHWKQSTLRKALATLKAKLRTNEGEWIDEIDGDVQFGPPSDRCDWRVVVSAGLLDVLREDAPLVADAVERLLGDARGLGR